MQNWATSSGLDTVTSIVALATKTSVAVAKLWLDFSQTSPDGKCDYVFFFPVSSPGLTRPRMIMAGIPSRNSSRAQAPVQMLWARHATTPPSRTCVTSPERLCRKLASAGWIPRILTLPCRLQCSSTPCPATSALSRSACSIPRVRGPSCRPPRRSSPWRSPKRCAPVLFGCRVSLPLIDVAGGGWFGGKSPQFFRARCFPKKDAESLWAGYWYRVRNWSSFCYCRVCIPYALFSIVVRVAVEGGFNVFYVVKEPGAGCIKAMRINWSTNLKQHRLW